VITEIDLHFDVSLELIPGVFIKSLGMKSAAASIAVQAPLHVSVVKAESRDPDVIAFRQALAATVRGSSQSSK
jgi:sRNA-binding carbon storage regulator CsrA